MTYEHALFSSLRFIVYAFCGEWPRFFVAAGLDYAGVRRPLMVPSCGGWDGGGATS